jgi:hypothetical protein
MPEALLFGLPKTGANTSSAEHSFYHTNQLTGKVRNLLQTSKILPPEPIHGIKKYSEKV